MLDKFNNIIDDLSKQCLKKGINEDYFKHLAFELADLRDNISKIIKQHPSIVPTEKLKGISKNV